MIHIKGSDFASGNLYNGTYEMSSRISGSLQLLYHHFGSRIGSIPWCYTNANTIKVQRVSDSAIFSINLGELQDGDDKGASATAMGAVFTSVLGGDFTSLAHDSANLEFDVVLGVAYDILWLESSARYVFDKTANELNVTTFSMSDKNVNDYPKFLEVHIAETSSQGVTSRSTRPDLLISTVDTINLGQKISLSGEVDEINISWYRENISGQRCPIAEDWDLIFEAI